MSLWYWVMVAIAIPVVGLLCWTFNPAIVARRHSQVSASRIAGRLAAMSVEKPSVALSIVVPAYNEEERLNLMLDPCLAYLKKRETAERCARCARGAPVRCATRDRRWTRRDGLLLLEGGGR